MNYTISVGETEKQDVEVTELTYSLHYFLKTRGRHIGDVMEDEVGKYFYNGQDEHGKFWKEYLPSKYQKLTI